VLPCLVVVFLPTNGEMHTAILGALKLGPWIPDINQIASVYVATTDIGLRILASDEQKWRPTTARDRGPQSSVHNFPELIDGEVTLKRYSPEKITDAGAYRLMDKVAVTEDPALTAPFPQHLGNRVCDSEVW